MGLGGHLGRLSRSAGSWLTGNIGGSGGWRLMSTMHGETRVNTNGSRALILMCQALCVVGVLSFHPTKTSTVAIMIPPVSKFEN